MNIPQKFRRMSDSLQTQIDRRSEMSHVRQRMNIAFAGRAGSGKDTAAEYLIQKYGYRKVSFAEPIKVIRKALFPDWPERDPRCREFLQKFGTDICRAMNPDVWVRQFEQLTSEKYLGQYPLVCTDVRFPNEAEWLLKHGWTVILLYSSLDECFDRICERDGRRADMAELNHASESHFGEIERLHGVLQILNRGTVEDLHQNLENLLKQHGWKAA